MSASSNPLEELADRARRRAWWMLLLFVSLGLVLEGFHGVKAAFYLDEGNQLRRELWRLAHAHGTLVALVQLAFAASLRLGSWRTPERAGLAGTFLGTAGLLLPVGFFLGGVAPSESDPWVGVWLAPLGGLCLVLAVLIIALENR